MKHEQMIKEGGVWKINYSRRCWGRRKKGKWKIQRELSGKM